MSENEYITLQQAADEIYCSKDKLLRAKRAGVLETRKPGKEIITTRAWLKAWLDSEETDNGKMREKVRRA